MAILHLRCGTRNGEVISKFHQGDEVIRATVLFRKNDQRGLPEISLDIQREHIWELIPLGSREVAQYLRVTPIGHVDVNLLYGPYRIQGKNVDPGFVQSPFTGRWDHDNFIFHLRHMGFGTDHRVRAIWLRHVPGVLAGDCEDVFFNEGGSFSAAN